MEGGREGGREMILEKERERKGEGEGEGEGRSREDEGLPTCIYTVDVLCIHIVYTCIQLYL